MNKRLKEAGRLVAGVGLPPSLKEESYITRKYGYDLPANAIVGIKVEGSKIYKVTQKRIVEVDPRKDFKDFVKKHPDKDLLFLLDEYSTIFRTNHLQMMQRLQKVRDAKGIAASTASQEGVSE